MIRIGHNPNTNMLPMFYFLPKEHNLFKMVTGEPAEHNLLLAHGQIDMAPISSFAYGQSWEDYAILPDLSVTNLGSVGSILLFSRLRLEELDGKKIALTNQSATSVNLLKIILHHFYGVRPAYITQRPILNDMLEDSEAALLIGDSAIRAAANLTEGVRVYDLGQQWLEKTGCSMTYAVWAYPRSLIKSRSSEIVKVHKLLLSAKYKALSDIEQIYIECENLVGLNKEYWEDYFSRFSYDLNLDNLEGLSRYYQLCYELDLLNAIPELNLWPVKVI